MQKEVNNLFNFWKHCIMMLNNYRSTTLVEILKYLTHFSFCPGTCRPWTALPRRRIRQLFSRCPSTWCLKWSIKELTRKCRFRVHNSNQHNPRTWVRPRTWILAIIFLLVIVTVYSFSKNILSLNKLCICTLAQLYSFPWAQRFTFDVSQFR